MRRSRKWNATLETAQREEVTRSKARIELEKPNPDLRLQRHDVLTLLGPREQIEGAAKFLGYADRATPKSDIAFMSVAGRWPSHVARCAV